MHKPTDAKLYWETFLTPENEKYFFCAATETTVWERPPKPAIVLKHHWACFEADGPDVYFAHDETNETSWELDVAIDDESRAALSPPAPAPAPVPASEPAPADTKGSTGVKALADAKKKEEEKKTVAKPAWMVQQEEKKKAEEEKKKTGATTTSTGGVSKPAWMVQQEAKKKAEEEKKKAEEEAKKKKLEEETVSKPVSSPVTSTSYPTNPDVYWQTFKEDDGEEYYYCETTGVTTRDTPNTTVTVGTETIYPILLPVGWICSMDTANKVNGFLDIDDKFFATLPEGSKNTAPQQASAPAPAPAPEPTPAPTDSSTTESSTSEPAKTEETSTTDAAPTTESTTTATDATGKPTVDPLERAYALARAAIVQYRARKANGKRGFAFRPWLFRNTITDSYLTVNPAETSTLTKILSDPMTFQKVTVLSGADAKEFGFDDTLPIDDPAVPSSQWNAAADPGTGRPYFFNVDTKETAWEIPAGGRIVARVVPRDHPVLIRVLSFSGTVQELERRRIEAAALEGRTNLSDEAMEAALAAQQAEVAAEVHSGAYPEVYEGWLQKSDPRGKNFQKRWLRANGRTGELSWYQSSPNLSSAKFNLKEDAKGFMPMGGSTIELVPADKVRGLPTPYCISISSEARSMKLCAATPDIAQGWVEYLAGMANGQVLASLLGGGNTSSSSSSSAPVERAPPHEGGVEVSTPDGKNYSSLYASLDPESRLLIFFSSPNKETGTERAVVDMLSSTIFPDYPGIPNAPLPPTPVSPVFWIQVDDTDGIFGPVGGKDRVGCTAIVTGTPEEREQWIAVLNNACDLSTMRQQTEQEKAMAPILTTTLLHNQKNAGMFNSLGSVVERKIIVHPASKKLTVFNDAAGTKAAIVLDLSAQGVQFNFRCDDKSPRKDFGNLKVEIDAPIVGKPGITQTHVFRTRTFAEYNAWAAALAAL